jgi:hypothetical protein
MDSHTSTDNKNSKLPKLISLEVVSPDAVEGDLSDDVLKNMEDYVRLRATTDDKKVTYSEGVISSETFKQAFPSIVTDSAGKCYASTSTRDRLVTIDPSNPFWKKVYGTHVVDRIGNMRSYKFDGIPEEHRRKHCVMFFGKVHATADSYEEARKIADEKFPYWACTIYVPQ